MDLCLTESSELLQTNTFRPLCVYMESDHGPLSYQDSVLPLNYTRTQGIMYLFGNERPFKISIYQDSVLPLNYTRLRYASAMQARFS